MWALGIGVLLSNYLTFPILVFASIDAHLDKMPVYHWGHFRKIPDLCQEISSSYQDSCALLPCALATAVPSPALPAGAACNKA
jgi:hypothetical protein